MKPTNFGETEVYFFFQEEHERAKEEEGGRKCDLISDT